ncbi:hypothetical protein HHI36_011362 [Cryptolaemus montrouzieri]|uniref:CRAL-TRIO domain-containing protein n=1 Tax=Cryptolaemus montrouzieri TaxID=559131 RepID=A0ABD2MLG2_9CUCU
MKLSDLSSERENILKLYNKTPSDIKQDIALLREWMKKQAHLPADLIQDDFLERHLLKNKFSVEATKSKVEHYCIQKVSPRYKYLYEVPRPSSPLKEPQFYIPLPKLTDDFARIVISRIKNEDEYDMLREFGGGLYLREFTSRYDYNDGEIFIFDFSNCSSSSISKFRVNIFADGMACILKGHSAKLLDIHIINRAAKILLTLIKPIIPPKLRIQIHDDYDSLKKIVPAKCLPKEYGGELGSIDDILGDWDKIFKENDKLLEEYINIKASGDFKHEETPADQVQGTFKKLNID